MQIEVLKEVVGAGKIIWTDHGRKRMEQRKINKEDIISGILQGEIIEDYPNSYPFPSCLILAAISNNKMIHIVIGYDGEYAYLITVYIPDEKKFEVNLKTRRKK